MAENEKKVEEVPVAEDAPLSREELAARFELIAARARAVGMSPLQLMARSYADRGMKVLDGFLSALEESPKKPSADSTEKKV